jgi:hypothetical protein
MLERLKPESLTDVKAGRYIEAVNQHYHDTDETDDITEQIARDLNMLVDYCIWIVLVRDWHQDALNAVREMQALAVTVDTLESLQSWIQTSEELSAWH